MPLNHLCPGQINVAPFLVVPFVSSFPFLPSSGVPSAPCCLVSTLPHRNWCASSFVLMPFIVISFADSVQGFLRCSCVRYPHCRTHLFGILNVRFLPIAHGPSKTNDIPSPSVYVFLLFPLFICSHQQLDRYELPGRNSRLFSFSTLFAPFLHLSLFLVHVSHSSWMTQKVRVGSVRLNRELTRSLGRFPREGRRKSWVSTKNMYISDKWGW